MGTNVWKLKAFYTFFIYLLQWKRHKALKVFSLKHLFMILRDATSDVLGFLLYKAVVVYYKKQGRILYMYRIPCNKLRGNTIIIETPGYQKVDLRNLISPCQELTLLWI